jgi:hypothetical protein
VIKYATEKFAKLLGDGEIGAILQRLDRLTQDEARMTVAQTLGTVHGLVGNLKIIMEDAYGCTIPLRHFSEHLPRFRWKGINR